MNKLPLLALLGLSGCATLMHGTTQAVNIKTTPPGAECKVYEARLRYKATVAKHKAADSLAETETTTFALEGADRVGERFTLTAPAAVNLRRGAAYDVECAKDGVVLPHQMIEQKATGWLWGNILYGGFPGLIVDGLSGGWYNLQPDVVALELPARQ